MAIRRILFPVFFLLVFSVPTSAVTVISGDQQFWYQPDIDNPEGYYVDVDMQGLDWMKLTDTRAGGLNYYEMTEAFSDPTSDYFGWRYATGEEAGSLVLPFLDYGLSTQIKQPLGGTLYFFPGIEWFMDTFNDGESLQYVYGTPSESNIGGVVADRAPSRLVLKDTGVGWSGLGWPEQVLLDSECFKSTNYCEFSTGPRLSHMLVRPSAVPIPAAAWLFGSALLGLAGLKRRA